MISLIFQNTLGKNRLKPAPVLPYDWEKLRLRLRTPLGRKLAKPPGSYKCKGFHRGLSPFVRGLSPFALFATAVTMQWTRDAEGGGAVAAFGP